jgi:hypothetical protein
MNLNQAVDGKSRARADWATAPVETKLAALIRLQTIAREMARAAGRPFEGVVWPSSPRVGGPVRRR